MIFIDRGCMLGIMFLLLSEVVIGILRYLVKVISLVVVLEVCMLLLVMMIGCFVVFKCASIVRICFLVGLG